MFPTPSLITTRGEEVRQMKKWIVGIGASLVALVATATSGGGAQHYMASDASVCDWGKTGETTLYANWAPVEYSMPYPLFPAQGLTIVNGVVTAWDGTGPVDMIIPEGVTAIGKYVFHRAWWELGVHVRSVKLPESLVTIAEGAFVGSHLEAVSFGSNVTTIGHSAFANTHLSGEVRLPDGVVSIGKQSFMGTRITDIYLPASLRSVARASFESCESLLGIHFAGNAPSLDLSTNDSFVSRSTSLFADCNENAEVYIVKGTDGWKFGSVGGVATWPMGDVFARYVKYESGEPVYIDAVPSTAASEYNGYLADGDGNVKGTIQVKVGKPGKKDGKASVNATVVVGTKKVTLKAASGGKAAIAFYVPTEIELVGGEVCEIVLGSKGLAGYYGAYAIYGFRNFFSSKDKGEVADANAAISKWLGSLMVIWDGGSLSVSIAAKGKVNVSGTLTSGTKVSASTVLLVGEEWCCASIAAPKANLSFVLWLSRDGKTATVEGLGEGVLVGGAGTLADGAAFRVPIDAPLWSYIPGTVLTRYLPYYVPVTKSGTKWTLPKAGKITMKNGVIDDSKAGDNPSGLKLTYKAKDGTFSGSFKVYTDLNGKLKATSVTVKGFLLEGIGYGTATVKGFDSVAVTIE